MKKNMPFMALAFVGAALTLSSVAFAQADPGAAPGGGARAGRGQGGRPGQGGRGGAQASPATIPVSAYSSEIKLSADQVSKIEAIQKKYAADTKDLVPQPGGDRQAMQELRAKRQEIGQQATKDIEAVLSDDQKTKLAAVLKDFTAMQMVGIPAAALGDLKLTADQKSKILAIAKPLQAKMQEAMQAGQNGGGGGGFQAIREEMMAGREKALEVLTAEQKTKLEKYQPQRRNGAA
jgi:Spy/CpxP family protein refolding chaperone